MTRKAQAAASRDALIEAARSCFAANGYAGTTVAAILDRAGMARGALYHYFPGGKREIFDAVFERINEAFHARRDSLSSIDSPVARIRSGAQVFLELCIDDDFARIALTDAPEIIPGQAERGSSYRLLREQLDAATRAGEMRNLDVEATAIALYGAIRSAGEFVVGADERERAAATAIATVNALVDGLVVT